MEELVANNSEEMKTQVQTYLIEETKELIYDNEKLEEWENLVKKLGLEGQTNIQKPTKSPIPFLCMNDIQINIISTLCPRHVEIDEYNLTPIPVELLEMVALSMREEYFQRIEIWYDEKEKCPAVVGITGHFYESSWHNDSNESLKGQEFNSVSEAIDAGAKHVNFHEVGKYLIGKWADVKEDFVQLAQRAKERFCMTERTNQERIIKDAKRKLEDLNIESFQKFGV